MQSTSTTQSVKDATSGFESAARKPDEGKTMPRQISLATRPAIPALLVSPGDTRQALAAASPPGWPPGPAPAAGPGRQQAPDGGIKRARDGVDGPDKGASSPEKRQRTRSLTDHEGADASRIRTGESRPMSPRKVKLVKTERTTDLKSRRNSATGTPPGSPRKDPAAEAVKPGNWKNASQPSRWDSPGLVPITLSPRRSSVPVGRALPETLSITAEQPGSEGADSRVPGDEQCIFNGSFTFAECAFDNDGQIQSLPAIAAAARHERPQTTTETWQTGGNTATRAVLPATVEATGDMPPARRDGGSIVLTRSMAALLDEVDLALDKPIG
jgi:hypothetical protein